MSVRRSSTVTFRYGVFIIQLCNGMKKTKERKSSSEMLNRRLWILSVVHVIFLPINLITSLFGVNLGGIPGSNYKYGFYVLLGALVIIWLTVVIFLIWKDWI